MLTSNITTSEANTLVVKGTPIGEIISSVGVGELVALMAGVPVTKEVAAVLTALIVAGVDHGVQPPSAVATRLVASVGGDLQKALMAGLACMGEIHGPVAKAVEFFSTYTIGAPLPKRVPGFGHPIHSYDPRVEPLRKVIIDNGFADALTKLDEVSAKIPVRPNYAAVAGAVVAYLGLPPAFGQLILILGRLIGLTSHYVEQQTSGEGPLSFCPSKQTFE